MTWTFLNARHFYDEHRHKWDAINRSQAHHILLDSVFVGALVRYFGSDKTVLAISDDETKPGMLILTRVRSGFWQTFQPAQGPLGLILLSNRDNLEAQIVKLIQHLPGYPLCLSVCQQDPDFTCFEKIGESAKIQVIDYIRTARLSLKGTFEEYWQKRGKDLARNLDRRCRQLAKRGIEFELLVDRSPECVAGCIREYSALETSGWKFTQGTAVSAEGVQGKFYREILERFCMVGEGVIYRLLFNGKTVASQLGLQRNGMLVLLKMAYDENFKEFSPGFLLQREIIRSNFSQSTVKVIEFYGRVRDGWTSKWTDEIRTMYHINFYRYDFVSAARSLIKHCHRLFRGETSL
jgi:hypothetical protein